MKMIITLAILFGILASTHFAVAAPKARRDSTQHWAHAPFVVWQKSEQK
jgi:hypothetical protein